MPAPNVPTWADGSAGATPVSPTRLNQMSTAILEVFNRLLPVITNFNPPNLTAGSSAEWDIPLGITLAGAHTEWAAVYAAGLDNAANSRISSRGARPISTTTVRLTVRNAASPGRPTTSTALGRDTAPGDPQRQHLTLP